MSVYRLIHDGTNVIVKIETEPETVTSTKFTMVEYETEEAMNQGIIDLGLIDDTDSEVS